MYFDRKAVKQKAKHLVRAGTPAVCMVTLVFLAATDWVSTIADLVVTNPITVAMETFYSWYDMLVQSGGSLSEGSINILSSQIWSSFQGTHAMIALLVVLLVMFYSMVVSVGYDGYTLRVMRGQQAGYGELFSRFYMAGRIIILNILSWVFIALWTCLFIFPGVIAFYRYRMAVYILLDDPDVSALGALRRSKAMMRGHKLELFMVDLSFLGWNLLYYIAYNLSYSVVYSFSYQPVLADIVSLLVGTVIYMFLGAYIKLTTAGYYLHLVSAEAPPVNEPWSGDGGGGRYDSKDGPWNDDNQGWNR